MVDIKKIIREDYDEIEKAINEYNEALKENDLTKANKAAQKVKDAEAAYADAKCMEVFAELAKAENPVKAAIAKHSYEIVSHKTKHEENQPAFFEITKDKVRQIDLVRFFEYIKESTMWKYSVERFNQLLALRAANELKMTKEQIKKICDSFYMNSLSRQIDMGKTPDSNTAICKQLQQVFDEILYEDNGNGKNIYRVNSHDVAYLLMCYTKRSNKKLLTVSVAKNVYMHRLVLDIMHRVVTGKTYDLEYRMISKDNDKSATETKPVTEEKSETETVKAEVSEQQ